MSLSLFHLLQSTALDKASRFFQGRKGGLTLQKAEVAEDEDPDEIFWHAVVVSSDDMATYNVYMARDTADAIGHLCVLWKFDKVNFSPLWQQYFRKDILPCS